MKTYISFVLVLIIGSGGAFFAGKKVGYDNGMSSSVGMCKYLCEAIVSPTPTPVPQSSQPSERSLKVAAWAVTNSSDEMIKDMIARHPEWPPNIGGVTRGMAFHFDEHPENLVLVEELMKKDSTR